MLDVKIMRGRSETLIPFPAKTDVETAEPVVQASSKFVRVALAGNPNSGKSTVFNALTGARQHVGNWPGKTVERKVGRFELDGMQVELVDLPGIYSLSAFSMEEMIARDFIVNESPDVVVCVVDASNLERNLYLTVQLLELGVPVVVALNMSDQAAARGLQIDTAILSAELGAPVVSTIGSRGVGMEELKAQLANIAGEQKNWTIEARKIESMPEAVHSCH